MNVRGVDVEEDVLAFFEVHVCQCSLLFLSSLIQQTPATRNKRPAFKLDIPNRKDTLRHDRGLYIASDPNPWRPQKQPTTETMGSLHSPNSLRFEVV